jgi:hypothetical protein
VVGAVLLLAGCSDPAPTDTPAPPPTVATTAVPSTPAASSATPTPTASASTPAPRPSASDEASVEPSRAVETAPPKQLDQPTRTAGARVSLVSVRAADIKASSPSDQSGPGVLVRLELENTTSRTLDLSFVSVSIEGLESKAATLVDGPPTRALAGSLKAGARAQGTYAFLLADARATPLTVAVFVTSGQPVVTFRGRAS